MSRSIHCYPLLGKKHTGKSGLGIILEEAEHDDDSSRSSNHGRRNGNHVDEDDDEYRVRQSPIMIITPI